MCSISNEGALTICLPTCDPLDASVCDDDEGCYQVNDAFQCAPDASGEDGQVGDPCEFINVCEPGLMCATGGVVPNCFATGCCTEYCDTEEPDNCSIVGTDCVAVFEAGAEPEPCHTDTGVCISP